MPNISLSQNPVWKDCSAKCGKKTGSRRFREVWHFTSSSSPPLQQHGELGGLRNQPTNKDSTSQNPIKAEWGQVLWVCDWWVRLCVAVTQKDKHKGQWRNYRNADSIRAVYPHWMSTNWDGWIWQKLIQIQREMLWHKLSVENQQTLQITAAVREKMWKWNSTVLSTLAHLALKVELKRWAWLSTQGTKLASAPVQKPAPSLTHAGMCCDIHNHLHQ